MTQVGQPGVDYRGAAQPQPKRLYGRDIPGSATLPACSAYLTFQHAGCVRSQEMRRTGAGRYASAFLEQHADTRARFERVADLVQGFETPFGLELLSTVHWVATHGDARTADDVVARTYAWGDRKRQFSERQIRLALDSYQEGLDTR